MTPEQHALLSASASDRWIHCPPSARLCENMEDRPGPYAAEGTDAHTLAEYRVKRLLGIPAEDPTENLSWYNSEMDEHTEGYAQYVLEAYEEAKKTCPDPAVSVEQRVDFSKWVKEGFGTADCIIAADGTLRITDFKYGAGVQVNAEKNPQLMCYALGALELFDGIYDIDNVKMAVYQPRRQNIGEYELSKDELLSWAENVLRPAADLAFKGEGEYEPGEWCVFCRAKTVCRARAESYLKLEGYGFKSPPLLEDEEIEDILARVDGLTGWASDVKDFALRQALSGKTWRGFKLAEGRSVRKYTDEAAVAETVEKAGYDPFEKKLLGVTEMQKMLGRRRFDELLSSLVEKPKGKPVLVPESDKRPAYAGTDFKEES